MVDLTKDVIAVGIDPPVSVNCGWSVVGLISGNPTLFEKYTQIIDAKKFGDKTLEDIFNETSRLLTKYKPIAICMERQLGGGFQFGRAKLNEFVGVIKLAAYKCNVPVVEISPAHLKMIIAGHGKAPKEYIMENVAKTFGLAETGEEHECDAAAFGLTYFIDNGWTGYQIKSLFTKEMYAAIMAEKKAKKALREQRKKDKEAKAANAKKKAKVSKVKTP